MRASTALITIAASICVLAGSSHAGRSAFPGRINGRIVYNDQSGALVLVNPDGTGLVRLAATGAPDLTIGASWSPDGRLIAYQHCGSEQCTVWTVAPDGGSPHQVRFRCRLGGICDASSPESMWALVIDARARM